jgi:EAL domain-containing protein (putative c-di-GMP-specific phosphodiesterase class I)
MNNHTLAEKILSQFKAMGLQIAMDDFGTGYSSLALLNKLPIDKIKIDKSFIQDMFLRPENEQIVDSIISLAHKLGMIVIAEGVEDTNTCKRLHELKCDLIQGFLISPSLDLPELIDFVKSGKTNWD